MAINKVCIYKDGGQQTLIDLSNDSVTVNSLLKGFTAHDRSGKLITGKATINTGDLVDVDGGIPETADLNKIYRFTNTSIEVLVVIEDNVLTGQQLADALIGGHVPIKYIMVDELPTQPDASVDYMTIAIVNDTKEVYVLESGAFKPLYSLLNEAFGTEAFSNGGVIYNIPEAKVAGKYYTLVESPTVIGVNNSLGNYAFCEKNNGKTIEYQTTTGYEYELWVVINEQDVRYEINYFISMMTGVDSNLHTIVVVSVPPSDEEQRENPYTIYVVPVESAVYNGGMKIQCAIVDNANDIVYDPNSVPSFYILRKIVDKTFVTTKDVNVYSKDTGAALVFGDPQVKEVNLFDIPAYPDGTDIATGLVVAADEGKYLKAVVIQPFISDGNVITQNGTYNVREWSSVTVNVQFDISSASGANSIYYSLIGQEDSGFGEGYGMSIGDNPEYFIVNTSNKTVKASDELKNLYADVNGEYYGKALELMNVDSAGVDTIEMSGFYNMKGLRGVSLMGIVDIRSFAFTYCSNLEVVELDANISHIGNGAFGYTNLKVILYKGTAKQWISLKEDGKLDDAWDINVENDFIIICSDGTTFTSR